MVKAYKKITPFDLTEEDFKNIPDAPFYIGQEYVEDEFSKRCNIKIFFISPGVVSVESFYYNKNKIKIEQLGEHLMVEIEKEIPCSLIADLKKNIGESFFLGYISNILPIVNNRLIKQRYSEGHYLIRTFSAIDIFKILLETENDNFEVRPPGSIMSFPLSSPFAKIANEIFIRDLIDAGGSYFNDNYDDCIRKIITSAENAFEFYKLKGARKFLFFKNNKFRSIVKSSIFIKNNLGRGVVAENLLFIYKLRNKIVHSNFRLNSKSSWFCKKAMGTLFYLYKFLSKNKIENDYVFSLEQQFLMLDYFCRGHDIDFIRQAVNADVSEDQIMDSPEKRDKSVFEGLRISKEDKSIILRS